MYRPHKPEKPEIHHGNKSQRLNLYIALAAYVLLAIALDPLVNFLLLPPGSGPFEIVAMGQKKQAVMALLYSFWRLPIILFFLWFGFRVVASLRLPPARMPFPFTVTVIKGKYARMFGILCMLVSLVLLVREIHLFTQVQL